VDADADRLRADYQQTTDLLRTLTDVRFKLLALVPTLSGAAVAVLGHPTSAAELIAVGLLGLTATLGVLLYELRNSQLSDYALRRAQSLEAELGFGLYRGAPVSRDRALILVYSAALAGWSYLTAWGALHAAHVERARPIGGVVAVGIGLLLLAELGRINEPGDHAGRLAAQATAELLEH
jgi:hypothetical protein